MRTWSSNLIPLINTGVDYFGAIEVRIFWKTVRKVYYCLLVCV